MRRMNGGGGVWEEMRDCTGGEERTCHFVADRGA